MSNKEQIISLLDNIPDYKMGYVLAYVQGIAADKETEVEYIKSRSKNTKKEDSSVSSTIAGQKNC